MIMNVPQQQKHQPGSESKMIPQPKSFMEDYKAAGKLAGKVAIVTGGDSGIGRAVCIAFAKEGADVAFAYLEEEEDANITEQHVVLEGVRCLKLRGDIGDKAFCQTRAETVVSELGRVDILVNNAAEQHVQSSLVDISEDQLQKTFATNVFGPFCRRRATAGELPAGRPNVGDTHWM